MAWVGVVTNAGRALLDSYAAGGHTLNLTGATVGSGTVDEANLRIQTSVSSEKDSASIISAKEIDGGVKYKVQVGPASASVGEYTAHQIGLWAKLDNGANTLLMLAQDAEAGVSVPLASVSPAFAFALFLALSVDNTDDLTVNIDESAYVTVGTMRGAIDELKVLPFVVDVTSGQWSGSGSDWYITVTADNVTEDSILVPNYDNASAAYLKGPVWCVPAEGSFTIHTSAIPSGTVKIMVQMLGVMGEAHYQVLADVYSKSQTYSKDQAVAKTDIVNNLTSTAANKPLSAAQGKALGDSVAYHEYKRTNGSSTSITSYSSASNPYTVPDDGYIRVTGTDETIQWLANDGVNKAMLAKSDGAAVVSVFVRKGMTVFIENPSGARFMQFRAPV